MKDILEVLKKIKQNTKCSYIYITLSANERDIEIVSHWEPLNYKFSMLFSKEELKHDYYIIDRYISLACRSYEEGIGQQL